MGALLHLNHPRLACVVFGHEMIDELMEVDDAVAVVVVLGEQCLHILVRQEEAELEAHLLLQLLPRDVLHTRGLEQLECLPELVAVLGGVLGDLVLDSTLQLVNGGVQPDPRLGHLADEEGLPSSLASLL